MPAKKKDPTPEVDEAADARAAEIERLEAALRAIGNRGLHADAVAVLERELARLRAEE